MEWPHVLDQGITAPGPALMRCRSLRLGVVLALHQQRVALHRFRGFNQCQQACGSRTEGTIGQQLLLEGVELPVPQPAAVGQPQRCGSPEC